jgi:hypothetical protein
VDHEGVLMSTAWQPISKSTDADDAADLSWLANA